MARSRINCLALLAGIACWHSPLRRAGAETVLLDFTSASCQPCQQMHPVLKKMATDGYNVRAVDVNREPNAASKYRISVTPTFVVLVDGQERARLEGCASYGQLVEMMGGSPARTGGGSAEVRGQSPGGSRLDLATQVSAPAADASATPATFAAGPAPERVVDIQQPAPARGAAPRELSAPAPPTDAGQAARLVAASVRLSVEDPGGRSTGTGVIIDSRIRESDPSVREALVLTCGHLFRESAGKGAVEITTFTAGATGAEVRQKYQGVVMAYDLERDLALVRFTIDEAPSVAPVAPLGTRLEPGASVTSVGCNNGDNPTPWATRITAINRYQGHPNVEAAKAPVEGRSGGGLFNAQGQVIGVCYASEPKEDEGLYASLSSIHAKLDELQLSMVYQAPSGVGAVAETAPAADRVAAAPTPQSPFAVRGQDLAETTPAGLTGGWPTPAPPATAAAGPRTIPAAPVSAPVTATASQIPFGAPARAEAPVAPASLSPQEQAALEEIGRRAADAEVICIIRPKSPEGRSDVIKLNTASPAFIRALTGAAAGPATAAAPRALQR